MTDVRPIDLSDVVLTARDIIDTESVSHNETILADRVWATLAPVEHLDVERDGDTIVAATNLGREQRVIVAGHLDTVPLANNLPSRLISSGGEELLWGRGSVDMKGGVATHLYLAAKLTQPRFDVTWVFYDNEEVEAVYNGLGRTIANHPDWIVGDLAIVGEPTGCRIEAGCNGTLRIGVSTHGLVAHSGRSWLGINAIHKAAPILERLAEYEAAAVEIDGLVYREGLNAVGIKGGVATNSVPDLCRVDINYRFAPSSTKEEALARVKAIFADLDVTIEVDDLCAGAMPGLGSALGHELIESTAAPVSAKLGWTDVARFSELGMPALNYGPGEPTLAHTDDESCPVEHIHRCTRGLGQFLDPTFEYSW